MPSDCKVKHYFRQFQGLRIFIFIISSHAAWNGHDFPRVPKSSPCEVPAEGVEPEAKESLCLTKKMCPKIWKFQETSLPLQRNG